MASFRVRSCIDSMSKLRLGQSQDPVLQCLAPRAHLSLSRSVVVRRGYATESQLSDALSSTAPDSSILAINGQALHNPSTATTYNHYYAQSVGIRRPAPPPRNITTTIYDFPTFEPLRFINYPASHLFLPLRRDILQRAVLFEANSQRQGTASTKGRGSIHGSGRKLRPQKGTGAARLGDRKSPMLRGGGVAFGPHPRDFATQLPRKIYDLAWRTALSYRYRRGQLLVVQNLTQGAGQEELEIPGWRWMERVLAWNMLGRHGGKSMFVARRSAGDLLAALNTGPGASAGRQGEVVADRDVTVKQLLMHGTLVVEKRALDNMLSAHESDINHSVARASYI